MILREVAKIVTEKEYDDVDRNRIVDVHIESKFKVFGIRLFKRVFNEKLDTVDGGDYKSKEKRIGFLPGSNNAVKMDIKED
jgi:hypothetical protein